MSYSLAKHSISHGLNKTKPVVITPQISCGAESLWIIAGPCSVESVEQLEKTSEIMIANGVLSLRGGAFKPRTSPYSFQGLGEEALKILKKMHDKYNMTVVTEVMTPEHIDLVSIYADVLQVGSRNMQNFSLLKELGKQDKPVLLKRGMAATLDEFLWAAEYIISEGNDQVVLCERGIRSFDPETRNVLDLAAVAVLKQKTHLPVIVDPSHAVGRSDIIVDISRAAIAVGADGLIIEIHPDPKNSVSDSDQTLSLEDFTFLIESIKPVAEIMNRKVKIPLSEVCLL